MTTQSIVFAAIQHKSNPRQYCENLRSAEDLIKKAVKKGSNVVLLPELFATGYIPNDNVFEFGEYKNGKTLEWMREIAIKFQIYLGGGIAVYENHELYNRYYLCDSNGEICGYAQKQYSEAYCFKRGEGIFHIDTKFGRLGVAICADSHFNKTITQLQNYDIDILILPHAWPTLKDDTYIHCFAEELSKLIKTPIVLINGVGKIEFMQGIMGKLLKLNKFQLRGNSCIFDGKGNVLDKLENKTGFISQEIQLGKISNKKAIVPNFSGWVHSGSWILRNLIIPIDIRIGEKKYKKMIKKHIV